MGMYCLNMLAIALELARENPAYESVASKFLEHFVHIAHAMNDRGGEGVELWDKEDGFYYDVLHLPNGERHYLKVRSLVGLIPLLAVETLEQDIVDKLPGFKRRMQWFIDNHPDVANHIEVAEVTGKGTRRLLSLVNREQLGSVARYLLDESEFFSPYGIRAISRFHKDSPYVMSVNGSDHRVDYEPAESSTGLFAAIPTGAGPFGSPSISCLLSRSRSFTTFMVMVFRWNSQRAPANGHRCGMRLQKFSRRLTRIFLRAEDGTRPVFGGLQKFQTEPEWRDHIYFHEYFHGDNGAGIGRVTDGLDGTGRQAD